MRYSTLEYRNLYQVLLSSFSTLCDSSSNLTCLTKAVADHAITVTYNDDSSECESTTTLCNLSYTVDSNQAILKYFFVIYFYFIHCHNRLKFKTTITSTFSQLLYTTMVKVTITVENYCLNASSLSLLSNELANLSCLLLLRHLLQTE